MINKFHKNYNLINSETRISTYIEPCSFKKNPYNVVYNFTFISLIAPYLVNDLRLINITASPSTPKKSTILLKQSYLIYTWFYFLKTSSMGLKKNNVIKFAILPITRKSYTLTKAPMAHKTNSKEQFVFKFYKFKTSIKTHFLSTYRLESVDSSLLALLLTRSIFPIFGTNLLLLKYYAITLTMSDSQFLNYYYFLKNKN